MKPDRLMKDIEPNRSIGRNLLKVKDGDEIIDLIVEEPLRKACKVFRNKGIETVMSSANKNNILIKGTRPIEKEDVQGREIYLDRPTFEDAGKGYAWIMLNWDSLSKTNQDLLFLLEQRKGSNGDNIGEKRVWFISDSVWRLKKVIEEKDDAIRKFEEYSFSLGYNDRYPDRVVMLRMPVTEETTVTDVETYFLKLAEMFKQQEIEKNDKEENSVREK